ncbi:hypothetical protein [Mycobacterium montefiorense]|uniref:Uncharacterized protein n=1 Tax=Mycobacterium montefiorense TaxID=154654 RepID=A0AA37PIJ6_9MYCO|nr:hypothetical protein [Mycobacterium montefiorense]MCV7425308.1 hypothetical protein [Mycobacterium montefiorense]GBG37244.1 hypothetical protein MmonteBS_16160 [Mycobacterium montefiorense]GKU35744.1 hypothetical protein NJB14191_30900 [Mycobacterium montefiorense]GKU39708.1 hypothetical protein NJB14192_16990 [Mycobacterium montefiorense]GKU47583.1 hypothetical protein NJB14194_42010 [Mycobacterium montefiorense]
MITKLLAVGAIGIGVVMGQATGQAAPVVADPAFNDLGCTCQTPPPVPGQTSEDRINQGLHDAFTR